MAVKYDYDKINESLELLNKMKSDCSESRTYFGNVINNKLDVFLRDYVLKHYDFQKLVNLSSEIEENLKIYINWLNDANIRARQVQLRNEELAGELDDDVEEGGGVAQALYGVMAPTGEEMENSEPTQLVYGPAPTTTEEEMEISEPTQLVYGPAPTTTDEPVTEPITEPVSEPVADPTPSENTTPTVTDTASTISSSSLDSVAEKVASVGTTSKDLSETTTLKDLDDTVEMKTSTTTTTIPTYTTSQTARTSSTPSYSSSQKTTSTSASSTGMSKTIVAAGAVGLAGTMAGTGLLIGKKLQSYKFTPNDWDELNPAEQERITNTLYRVGFKDKEINTIMNATFKIERSELNVHIEKIESAMTNYNKFSEEFQKIYNYSLVGGGEVSKYLTFLTMIIDGKSISDQFNMYNIINPYLSELEEVDKTYQGIRVQDYME